MPGTHAPRHRRRNPAYLWERDLLSVLGDVCSCLPEERYDTGYMAEYINMFTDFALENPEARDEVDGHPS